MSSTSDDDRSRKAMEVFNSLNKCRSKEPYTREQLEAAAKSCSAGHILLVVAGTAAIGVISLTAAQYGEAMVNQKFGADAPRFLERLAENSKVTINIKMG